MLLTMSTAQAMKPAAAPASQLSTVTVPASTKVVPAVATMPKNTKTKSSPRPA